MRISSISRLTLAGVLTVVFAAAGAAQQQGPPKPAPEMEQLAFFEGMWTCEGKMNDSPMGPGGTMKSTVDVRKDLNGFFQTGTIKGTMANMPPFEGRFTTTYDPASKGFVMMWADNMGGWAMSTSPGFKGDALVYEGDMHMGAHTMKGRDTFAKSGPNTMKHTMEAQMEGKWVALGEETCTKK